MKRILRPLMVAAAALLLAIPSARADFEINVIVGGVTIFNAIDNVVEDDNPVAGTTSATNGLSGGALFDLNQALAGAGSNLVFTSLSATSNKLTGTGGFANLTVNGNVTGTGSVTIEVSDTGYTIPSGPASLTSSGNQTYTNPGAGSTGSFQSFFNQNDSQFGRVTAGGILSFTPPPSPGSVVSPPGVLTGPNPLFLGSITTPFSLTNVTELTLTGDANTAVLFQGSTAVKAVPEPGSVALLLLGGSALALRARRRRAVNA